MSDYIKCPTCGGEYYHKNPHDCPGNLDDHDERLGALEGEIEELKERVKVLEAGKTEDEVRQDARITELERLVNEGMKKT